MVNIEPSFEVDDKGRVICKKHTKYDHLVFHKFLCLGLKRFLRMLGRYF